MSIYAGDELYGDDVTSGPTAYVASCGYCLDGEGSCTCVEWCGHADCDYFPPDYDEPEDGGR